MPSVPSTDVRIDITTRINQTQRQFRNLRNQLNNLTSAGRRLDLQMRSIDRIWSLMAVTSGAALIGTFVKMAADLQKVQFQIGALTGDFSNLDQQMRDIITVLDKVPFTLNTMTKTFVRLKSAGVDPIIDENGNGPLKNLADAVAAFGGSDEIFKRAGIAIQQMAGKGVISMEELRQQLGEAIPSAMRIMAKELDLTVAEFIQQVSRGELEFERGFEALNRGLEKAFGGAGELMKTTLPGAIQQTVNEFNKLAKTVLLDTGALDVFTGAVNVFNRSLRELDSFLRGPGGQQAIEDFKDGIFDLLTVVEQGLTPFRNFISIIGDLVNMVTNITGLLPAEVVGGGILGFLLFGRSGIIPGALFGIVSEEIAGIISVVGGMVESLARMVEALGVDDIAAGGILGFLLFGKKGALFGVLVTAIDGLIKQIQLGFLELTVFFTEGIANLKAQADALFDDPSLFFTPGKLTEIGEKAGEKVKAALVKKIRESGKVEQSFHDWLFEKVTGEKIGREAGEKTGEGFLTGLASKIEDETAKFAEIRSRIQAQIKGTPEDIAGLLQSELKPVEKFGTFLERLEVQADSAGSAIKRFNAVLKQQLSTIDPIIDAVTVRLEEAQRKGIDTTHLERSLAALREMRDRAVALGVAITESFGETKLQRITRQLERINAEFKKFNPQGESGSGIRALDEALARVQSRFAGYQERLNKIGETIQKTIIDDQQKKEALDRLAESQQKLNAALAAELALTEERIRLKAEEQFRKISAQVEDIGIEQRIEELELAGRAAEAAALRTEREISQRIDNINAKIASVELDKLLTEEQKAILIERLEAIKQKTIDMSEEMIERAKFNASAWGQAMNSIAASMEDAFADTFRSLIKGTKSLKDVLLDFYDAVTEALIRYLAKEATMKILGGKGGFGLSSIFTPFGSTGLFGSLFGFQHGGSFIVGGNGGVDSNLVTLAASKGERIDITPAGEEFRGGSTEAQLKQILSIQSEQTNVIKMLSETMRNMRTNITLNALDAQSVRDMLFREGQGIFATMMQQVALNRKMIS